MRIPRLDNTDYALRNTRCTSRYPIGSRGRIGEQPLSIRVYVTSVLVDDQDKALAFYTDVLGFRKKTEIPLGEARWLTVVSPSDPEGTELLLEPDGHRACGPFKRAL